MTGTTAFIKAAVIGHPVAHSKSPLIHNHWIKQYRLAGHYDAIDIPPDQLANGIKRLIEDGYTGFNFTIPHKERACDLCDELDEAARLIGAVNTMQIKEGHRIGMNTDAFGFITNIKTVRPGFIFTGCTALVLGAGGAARAVIQGLLEEGAAKILLTNRTREKAEILATVPQIEIFDWEDRHDRLDEADLLINTTSLGMSGQPALDLRLALLPKKALVTDIVYAPLHTDLLKKAETQGNQTVTGIGMLLHQARPAFQAWFGVMPDVTPALEKLVLGTTDPAL
ncbi:MAG: shikimate dehydrogenase [Alphaproteobacteria bacterium]